MYCKCVIKPQRAYPTWKKLQLSINQVSVYTRSLFLPLDHLFVGGNTYCFFLLLCQTKTLQRKTKLWEVPIQEEALPPTIITVFFIYTYINVYIYMRVCVCVYTNTHTHTYKYISTCLWWLYILSCKRELSRGEPLNAGAAWETHFTIRVLQ